MNAKAQLESIINLKSIGLEQHLSSLNVRKAIRDKNDFLWFSTQDGLNKYDGNKIIQFTKNNTNQNYDILGSDCFATLYIPHDSVIYVMSAYEGLNIININTNRVIHKINTEKLLGVNNANWYKAMVNYYEHIIIATNDGKLIYFNKKTLKSDKIITLRQYQNSNLFTIEVVDDLLYIINTHYGIDIYNLHNNSLIKSLLFKNCNLKTCNINQICFKNKNIWFSSNTGIYIKNIDDAAEISPNKMLPNFKPLKNIGFVSSIAFHDNDIFISCGKALYKYNTLSNNYLTYQVNNKDKNDYLLLTNSFLFLEKKIVLAGVFGIGIFQSSNNLFTPFYSNEIKTLDHLYTLNYLNNKVYAGADAGFFKIDLKENKIDHILDKESVYSFEEINFDEYLISGTNGISIFKKGKISPIINVYPEFKKIENELFISITKIDSNTVLLASQLQTGVFVWKINEHNIELWNNKSNYKISDLIVNRIWNYKSDSIFIISESKIDLLEWKNKSIKNIFSKEKLLPLKTDVFMDMCKDVNGFWIASYGLGIVKLDKNFNVTKIVSREQGIENLGVYKIFNVADSLITLTTNNGLFIYNENRNKVTGYYLEDGLHSNSFEETSGFQSADTLILGGIKGFTIFNTKKYITNNIAPKLFFDEINIESPNNKFDTTNIFLSNLSIPNTYTQVKISFVGINYTNPARVNYWYRIKEIGESWIDLKTQNFIDLIGISPGKYTLEVKAANEDGVECEPIKMTLHFLPKWYQTLLFKILLALVIASLLFILYTFRIRQLKKVIAVRQKISQNLHDDIGSTLSAINMYTQVAKLQPEQNDFLNNIEENTQDVLSKLDDIIWSTNPKNDKCSNLLNRMEVLAFPLCKAKGVQFKIENENISNDQHISESVRQNLFSIFKEALNNALKYAYCSHIKVLMSIKNNNIHFSLTDNGKGFDTSLPTERNGLLNMQLRTKELKGKFNITSIIDKGTTVSVQIPM